MNPQVIAVEPQTDHKVLLTFDNKEIRVFDMSPYINRSSFFKQLHFKIQIECLILWRTMFCFFIGRLSFGVIECLLFIV